MNGNTPRHKGPMMPEVAALGAGGVHDDGYA